MPHNPLRDRFLLGPGSLIAGTLLAIASGSCGMYFYSGDRASLLYFFYVPVAAASVILGRMIGLALAAVAIAVAMVPSGVKGLDYLLPGLASRGEKIATLVLWGLFLMAMAWLVGWVSERGGSLTLTQGLGARAMTTIERMRRRMGQDIHDGIAQYAAVACMETEVLESMTSALDGEIQAQVQRVKQPLDLLVEEARSMIGNLRPLAMDPVAFAAGLAQLADGLRSRSGIACDLQLEGDFAAHSHSMRICVYRIVQEALANAERHSGATNVQVLARASRRGVELIVRDNGKGFEPDATSILDDEGHYGLQGMAERASYLGGHLAIRSAPGDGTSVIAHVPSYRGKGRFLTLSARAR